MLTRSLLLVAAVLAVTLAFAQPEVQPAPAGNPPGNPPPPRMGNALYIPNTPPVLEITPEGVFVIRSGVVAKFTAGLGAAAGTKELFPALPEPPKLSEAPTPEEREAMGKWMGLLAERAAAFSVLAREKMLYLVVGTKYFRANQQTLAVEAQADLMPAPEGLRRGVNTEAPQLKLDGGVLYVLIGQAFIAVDAQTGAVQHRMTLPKEMFPNAILGNVMRGGNNAPGGGNRNGGGGAGGGAAAGNGRNAAAPAPADGNRGGGDAPAPNPGR